jgi:hypothetical protein
MKAGIKTTEFWLAMVVTLAGAFATAYADAKWAKVAGMIAAALASAGYGFSRSQAKAAAAEAGAELLVEREYTKQAEARVIAKKQEEATEAQVAKKEEAETELGSVVGFGQGDQGEDYEGEEQA